MFDSIRKQVLDQNQSEILQTNTNSSVLRKEMQRTHRHTEKFLLVLVIQFMEHLPKPLTRTQINLRDVLSTFHFPHTSPDDWHDILLCIQFSSGIQSNHNLYFQSKHSRFSFSHFPLCDNLPQTTSIHQDRTIPMVSN